MIPCNACVDASAIEDAGRKTSDDSEEALTEEEGMNAAGSSTERHANADFLRPA